MPDRVLFISGALAGAAGVALSAYAAHLGGGSLATAASFLLIHAPALMLLARLEFGRMQHVAGMLLLVGLVMFCGDLASRAFFEARLFPMAAPVGGMAMIAGWLGVAGAALFSRRG